MYVCINIGLRYFIFYLILFLILLRSDEVNLSGSTLNRNTAACSFLKGAKGMHGSNNKIAACSRRVLR